MASESPRTYVPRLALRSSLAYFSVLPVGRADPPNAAAVAWLPFVGAVGGAIAGVAAAAVGFFSSHALAVAAAFGLTIALTGGIHLDGFLDGCDAFFAGVPAQRRLEILKDPVVEVLRG